MKWLMVIVCLTVLSIFYPKTALLQSTTPTEALPQLPRLLDTAYTPPTGKTIKVANGEELQTALNEASAGDEIVLQAGVTYTGNFYLPVKTGTDYIHIRSSELASLPPVGTRIFPTHSPKMPAIKSPNSNAAIRTEAGAHHYRLIGLEISVVVGVELNYGIVLLGDGSTEQNSLDKVPHDLIIDRCYIHGNFIGDVSRGVALNSASTAILDSYIANCHGVGFDTQAICGWNGPGPFKIINNYLEGAGENVLFGGADPAIKDLVPSDIEFRHNYLFKPLSWKTDEPEYSGTHWEIKNIFELKNAQRVLVDGNIFEHNWPDGQNGFAILFTPRNQDGTAPWTVVQDITFSNNIVRHVASAINVLGNDNIYSSQPMQRVNISNNLFDDIGGKQWGGSGRFLQMLNGASYVRVDHNTVFHTGEIIIADEKPSIQFIYTNNISRHNEYGVLGSGAGIGSSAIFAYFPGSVFEKNIIAGGKPESFTAVPNNYFPATLVEIDFIDLAGGNHLLATNSAYKRAGTNNSDIGADINQIEKAISGSDSFVPISATSSSVKIDFGAPLTRGTQIEYGTSTAYGKVITLENTANNITLNDLDVSTVYYYRIKAENSAAKTEISSGFRFATSTIKPPVINAVNAKVTGKDTTITWTTSEPTISQLEYGTTTLYENTAPTDAEKRTAHQVVLTGLQPSTLYHFRLKAVGADGTISVMNDQTFQTRRKRKH